MEMKIELILIGLLGVLVISLFFEIIGLKTDLREIKQEVADNTYRSLSALLRLKGKAESGQKIKTLDANKVIDYFKYGKNDNAIISPEIDKAIIDMVEACSVEFPHESTNTNDLHHLYQRGNKT